MEDTMSSEYHKIQTVYLRDPATKHRTLLEGEWALPEFGYLADNPWIFTEKVDGTNIRVWWDGERVHFGGRTDNAQIPAFLLARLQERFTPDAFAANNLGPMTLYGEGYGPKIQKVGKLYREDADFVLFDVFCGLWLERENVKDIADKLDIGKVPVIGRGTLAEMVERARAGFNSTWGDFRAEGIVARPAVELCTRQGKRLITKIKCKDFPA